MPILWYWNSLLTTIWVDARRQWALREWHTSRSVQVWCGKHLTSYLTTTLHTTMQLVRHALALPNMPLVVSLHTFAYWHLKGGDGRAVYYKTGEDDLAVIAQYYDVPALSVRWAALACSTFAMSPPTSTTGAPTGTRPCTICMQTSEDSRSMLYIQPTVISPCWSISTVTRTTQLQTQGTGAYNGCVLHPPR